MRERMVLPFSLQLEECFSIFIKNSRIYCRFRLKLRAMRLLRKHFIAKRLFQQLPNLKIRSLLKIKEGPSESTNASNSIYERGEGADGKRILLFASAKIISVLLSKNKQPIHIARRIDTATISPTFFGQHRISAKQQAIL